MRDENKGEEKQWSGVKRASKSTWRPPTRPSTPLPPVTELSRETSPRYGAVSSFGLQQYVVHEIQGHYQCEFAHSVTNRPSASALAPIEALPMY